jgi:hypothetical protein
MKDDVMRMTQRDVRESAALLNAKMKALDKYQALGEKSAALEIQE